MAGQGRSPVRSRAKLGRRGASGDSKLIQQLEEGIPILAWQTKQRDQVLASFPDMSLEVPGMVQGITHAIHTHAGVVVRIPACLMPQALREVIEQEVQQFMHLGVIEESYSPWHSLLCWSLSPTGPSSSA